MGRKRRLDHSVISPATVNVNKLIERINKAPTIGGLTEYEVFYESGLELARAQLRKGNQNILLTLRDDGRAWVRIDRRFKYGGVQEGGWLFLTVFDIETVLTVAEIAAAWEDQGYQVDLKVKHEKRLRVIMALRRYGRPK
jgi:hypothetical protein